MLPAIPKEIITLDPEGIDFDNREAVRALIIKLLNIIESQAQLIHELQNIVIPPMNCKNGCRKFFERQEKTSQTSL